MTPGPILRLQEGFDIVTFIQFFISLKLRPKISLCIIEFRIWCPKIRFSMIFFLFVIMYCQILAYMREFNKKLFIFKYFKNYANPKNIYPRRGGGVYYVCVVFKSLSLEIPTVNLWFASLRGGKTGSPLHAPCPSRFAHWNESSSIYKHRIICV